MCPAGTDADCCVVSPPSAFAPSAPRPARSGPKRTSDVRRLSTLPAGCEVKPFSRRTPATRAARPAFELALETSTVTDVAGADVAFPVGAAGATGPIRLAAKAFTAAGSTCTAVALGFDESYR